MSGVHEFNSKFKLPFIKSKTLKNVPKDTNGDVVLNDGTTEGKTVTSQVENVKEILKQVNENNNVLDKVDKEVFNPLDLKYADGVKYDNKSVEIYEFLTYMTEGKGLSVQEMSELLIAFVQEVVLNPQYGNTSIDALTQLINIMYTDLSSANSLELMSLIQTTKNVLLNQGASINNNDTTFGDIKQMVNNMIEEILAKRPSTEDPVVPPVNPNVDPEPDPVVIDTPEKAMEVLLAKMAEYVENTQNTSIMSSKIEECLLEFKEEAMQYIQLQFGYNEDFSNLIVTFLANYVEHLYAPKSGNYSFVAFGEITTKFVELMQNLDNFLSTSNKLMSSTLEYGRNVDVQITRIDIANNEFGYRFRGTEYIGVDNNITYNADGLTNQGLLLKFMLDYLRDTVFGGQLNESQLELLYSEVFKSIGGKSNCLDLNVNSAKYDENSNGTYFDDFLSKIMQVTSQYSLIDIDAIRDEDVNLDNIFGTTSSISASYINSNENDYLLSNDPTTRLIMGELINASNKYNITPNSNSLDFYNAFIKMINDEFGIESGNPPKLSKETLNMYIERYSIQGLKDLIHSDALRNAYYESTFKINGEIEGFYQDDSGDCWLLSGIMALNSSPEGKEIIKNAISYNPETGEYSVTFYGGWNPDSPWWGQQWQQRTTTYTFTKEELFELMATGMYSKIYQSEDGTCDWDLFLLEVAVSKLRQEQLSYNPYSNFAEDNIGDINIYMGSQDELISYLTGIDLNIIIGGDRSKDTTYHGASKNYRQSLHQMVNDLITQGVIDENGNIHNYAFYFSTSGHAYAVTRITGNRIYFINPADSSKEYYTTWDSFESGTITYYDSKTNKKVGTLTIADCGYVGPLDESPALN